MSYFFRYARNGGLCDIVKDGNYWYCSAIYPARLLEALGSTPIPYPEKRGAAWFDLRSLKKSMIQRGWELVDKERDCRFYETGNRTTKKKKVKK